MAFFQMNYHSDALRQGVSVNVIIPESAKTLIGMQTGSAGKYKTLFLLHGLSDDQTIWMRRTAIERYASEYGIAVVMPSVARSWYTDTASGQNFFTFVAEELPRVCRGFFAGMSDKREDTIIGGLSMGGYGALKIALRRPETFGSCISLSGALDLSRLELLMKPEEWHGVFGFDMKSSEEIMGGREDVYQLARDSKVFPKLYMWCGTEDALLDMNRRYDKLLSELGVPHKYEESEGSHTWKWWDLHIQDGLAYILG